MNVSQNSIVIILIYGFILRINYWNTMELFNANSVKLFSVNIKFTQNKKKMKKNQNLKIEQIYKLSFCQIQNINFVIVCHYRWVFLSVCSLKHVSSDKEFFNVLWNQFFFEELQINIDTTMNNNAWPETRVCIL